MIISIAMGTDTLPMLALLQDQKKIQQDLIDLKKRIRTASIQSDMDHVRELCEYEDELKERQYDLGVILKLANIDRREKQTTQENVRDMNLARQLYSKYSAKYTH